MRFCAWLPGRACFSWLTEHAFIFYLFFRHVFVSQILWRLKNLYNCYRLCTGSKFPVEKKHNTHLLFFSAVSGTEWKEEMGEWGEREGERERRDNRIEGQRERRGRRIEGERSRERYTKEDRERRDRHTEEKRQSEREKDLHTLLNDSTVMSHKSPPPHPTCMQYRYNHY